jgi:hypothetical protein
LIFAFGGKVFATLCELVCQKMIKTPRQFCDFNELKFIFFEFFLIPAKGFVVVALEYLDLVVLESWGSIKSVRETTDLVIALRARALPYSLHLSSQTLLSGAKFIFRHFSSSFLSVVIFVEN